MQACCICPATTHYGLLCSWDRVKISGSADANGFAPGWSWHQKFSLQIKAKWRTVRLEWQANPSALHVGICFSFFPSWYVFMLFCWCTATTLPLRWLTIIGELFRVFITGKWQEIKSARGGWEVERFVKGDELFLWRIISGEHAHKHTIWCLNYPSNGPVSLTWIRFSFTLQIPAFSNGNNLTYRHAVCSFSSSCLSLFISDSIQFKKHCLCVSYLDV